MPRTPREIQSHSTGSPIWTNPIAFEKDAFCFVRVRRARNPNSYGANWATDTPDSDLNLSFRLQQMTSMKVNPDGRFIRLTDSDSLRFPLYLYGRAGVAYAQRRRSPPRCENTCLNGGFLMLDDFLGRFEWENAAEVIKRVLPERSFVELRPRSPRLSLRVRDKVEGAGAKYTPGN